MSGKKAKKAAKKARTVTAYRDGYAAGTASGQKGIAAASVGKVAGVGAPRALKAAARLVQPADPYDRYLAAVAAGHSYGARAAAELLAKRERGEHHVTAAGGAVWPR